VTAPDVEAAAAASVNLLDLITTTALIANGENALTLPLAVNLPSGLLNVSTTLNVIESPQIAIGPPGRNENGDWRTQVRTAQVRLDTRVQSNIDLGVAQVDVDLALLVQVAQGSAWLKSIQCRNQQNPSSIVTIAAQPGIAALTLTQASDTNASAAAIRVRLLGLTIANVVVGLDVPLGNPGETDLEYAVNANEVDALPMVQRASSSVGGSLGSGLSGLADSLQLDVTLVGLPLLGVGAIVGSLLGDLLEPLLTQLVTSVLDPLLRLLGIGVGSLDIQLFTLHIGRPDLLI